LNSELLANKQILIKYLLKYIDENKGFGLRNFNDVFFLIFIQQKKYHALSLWKRINSENDEIT